MQKAKGFTIIELIVVVAIIAVLAAIVSINVVTYLNKGKDAAIKSDLETAQSAMAALIDSTTGIVAGSCTDTTGDLYKAYTAAGVITGASNTDCNSVVGAAAVCAQLKATSGDYFCVDSVGNKKQIAGTCVSTSSATVCPASGNF